MDAIIQDLVQIDHECAERVEEAKTKKFKANDNLQQMRKDLYDSCWIKHEVKLQKIRERLENEVNSSAGQKAADYENQKLSLEKKFNENKDAWVSDLVNRCLS